MIKNENGRSMVEMLGVLAIIGVLSVAGIAGYTMAMNKYKANEILNVASQAVILAKASNAGNGLTSGTNTTASALGLTTAPAGIAAATDITVTNNGGNYVVKFTNVDNDAVLNNIKTAAPTDATIFTVDSTSSKKSS